MSEQYSNGLLDYFKDPYVDCCDMIQSDHNINMEDSFKRLIAVIDKKPLDRFQVANAKVVINKHFEFKHRHCSHKKVSAFTYLKIHLSHLFG